MKVKFRLQGFLFGLIISSFCIPVIAASVQKNILVSYNGIKIYVDGNLITPKDGKGKVIEPFIYDGTTYLPVRAVGESLNKEVNWDGKTQSVFIGKKAEAKEYLGKQIKAYTKSSVYINEYPQDGEFMMAGNAYTLGITKSLYSKSDDYAIYNLDSKYTTLTGLYGPTDENISKDSKSIINIYGDNKLLASYDSKFGDLPKEFSVDVTNVTQLKIGFVGDRKFAVANAYLN